MRIGVVREVATGERRVALSPDAAGKLSGLDHEVVVETNAGAAAGFVDGLYEKVGAKVADRSTVLAGGGVLAQVRVSGTHDVDDRVLAALTDQHVVVGLVDPLWQAHNVEALATSGAAVLALELVPRISRAQSMDALSAMATVSGYEAVLLAASEAPSLFPMLITAAGTVPPSRVFVLGAGVAGLQAIATARRLGAVVEAFDVRPAAAEQIRSLGAKAIELALDNEDAEDVGGYAKAQSDDQNVRQQQQLTPLLADSDIVITTAAIPGARSPLLITTEMVEAMPPGALIVDLAAERGGNCELTEPDSEVVHQGVRILGPTDLPSKSPRTASRMLGSNIVTLLAHLASDGELKIDPDDEITSAMLVACGGKIPHERVLGQLGRDLRSSSPDGSNDEEE